MPNWKALKNGMAMDGNKDGVRVARCELRVACCGLRVAGCEVRVTGCEVRVTGCEVRVTGCGPFDFGFVILDFGLERDGLRVARSGVQCRTVRALYHFESINVTIV